MVPERDVDPANLYEQERVAFLALLRSLTPDALAQTVPATPDWAVRDVLAHVVGITADLNAGRFDADVSDEWTGRQVNSRRDKSIDEMAAEWDHEAPTFEGGLRLFGYSFGAHFLGDLMQHMGDVHAAIYESPVRDDESVTVALGFYLESFEETLAETSLGAIQFQGGDETWTVGSGDVVASVTATQYELLRALGGRRTPAEIRSLVWTGGAVVDDIVPLVSRYPAPTETLGEAHL